MTVSIKVHRGTESIGGTCIEVISESDRIILDLGLPLMENGGGEINVERQNNPTVANGMIPDVEGLTDGDCDSPILGVLLSHAHPDHYGLLEHVHAGIPIYMSEESKALIGVGNVFYPKKLKLPGTLARCTTFKQEKPFSLGPFTITPFLMDHSAFGASSLLIEVDGKRILYTGDMRAHGRKGKLFWALPHKVGHIDCMLMEGTTLGGKHHDGYNDEAAVEEGMVKSFQHDHATFVLGAGSNVDWLVSLYRATKRTNKLFVLDLYQFYLLTRLKQFSLALPPHDGDHVRVLYTKYQAEKLEQHDLVDVMTKEAVSRKISREEIYAHPDKMVMRISRGEMARLADKMKDQNEMRFIYSMWQGYLERDSDMANFPRQYGCEWQSIHTSGHAWLEDLQKLTGKIKPDMLVPIHTLQGDKFEKYFENVVRIKDGEEISLEDKYVMAKDFKRGITDPRAIEVVKAFLKTKVGKKLCELIGERKVIACIRNNYLDFYISGCVILTYKPLASKNIYKIHRKYLPKECLNDLESDKNYISLTQSGNCDDLIIEGVEVFSFYRQILDKPNFQLASYIEATGQKSFSEKLGIHTYINSSDQWKDKALIDLEVAFSISINDKRPCAKRVDLAWLESNEGKAVLRLVEVKVDTDSRLRSSKGSPEVLRQMNEYAFFIDQQKDHIIESYKCVSKNFCEDFSQLLHQKNKDLIEQFSNQQDHIVIPEPSLLVMITYPEKNNWGYHYDFLKQKCLA